MAQLVIVVMALGIMLMGVRGPVFVAVDVRRIHPMGQRVSPNGAQNPQEQRDGGDDANGAHHSLLTEAAGKYKPANISG